MITSISVNANDVSIVRDRSTTWSAIGKSVQECKDLESVLKTSGLDYTVEKRPVWVNAGPVDLTDCMNKVPNRFATVRMTDNHVYDIVSDKFEIVQNRDAFDFIRYIGDDISFIKAGETFNGMVYIIGALPDVDILGDAFTPYVIFCNGFNGKTKILAAITPLRIICQNQFNFAFSNAENTVAIRHVQNAQAKLEDAREVLQVTAGYMSRLTFMAERFASIKLGPASLDLLLDNMFPMKDAESINAFKRHQLEEARTAFKNAYLADDNSNHRGTAWGLVNAYTDFITHKAPGGNNSTKEEGKFINLNFKSGSMNKIFDAMASIGITAA